MKFFVIFACAWAAASAGIVAPVAPIHLPVIGPNGVPVDTAEVQHARATHIVHKAETHVRNGDAVVSPVVAPVIVASVPQHLPIIDSTGVPVDTAEVQHARAAHAVHKAEAHARNGDVAVVSTSVVPHHAVATPVTSYSAVATPVVAHHTVVPHTAVSHSSYVAHSSIAHPILAHHLTRRGIYAAYPTTFEVPVVTPNGVPLDTPEVAAAKTNHFSLVSQALARNGHYANYVGPYVQYAAPYIHGAYPVLAVNGAPLETPEVVVAKAAHFAAHAKANARIGHYVSPISAVLEETPEVAAAKSVHFAAHAEALTRNAPLASY